MANLRSIVDTEMIRFLVARDITCSVTGTVLDIDTCIVIRDTDGDPVAVFAHELYEDPKFDDFVAGMSAKGFVVQVQQP